MNTASISTESWISGFVQAAGKILPFLESAEQANPYFFKSAILNHFRQKIELMPDN